MKPYQELVVTERVELDDKIKKLDTFRRTETFAALSAAEQYRLGKQLEHMTSYSNVLGERIAAFKET